MRTVLLATAAAGLLAAGAGAAAAQTKILFNEFAPPKHIINVGIVGPWIDQVEKATQGRVAIEVPGNSLAPPPRQMDIVKDGIADGAYMFNGFLVKKAPLVQVSLLPGVTRSAEGSATALWRTYERYFADAGQYDDVVLLGFFATPPGEIFSLTDRQFRTVKDFESVKMWSSPGYTARAMSALGSVVVPGAAVQMYQVISKGTVDAFTGVSISSARQFNVLQYAKSVTVLPEKAQGPTFPLFLNKAKWQSLTEADRKAIRGVSGENLARLTRSADELEAEARAEYRKTDKAYIEASPELVAAVDKAWAPIRQEWVEQANKLGVDGAAALAFFRKTAQEVAEAQQ